MSQISTESSCSRLSVGFHKAEILDCFMGVRDCRAHIIFTVTFLSNLAREVKSRNMGLFEAQILSTLVSSHQVGALSNMYLD